MKMTSDGVGRWVRQLARPERLRVVVAATGVLVLTAIASVVVTADATTADQATRPLTGTMPANLVEAAKACPALTAARLAGQIMATTGFEATAEGGISGLTSAEWEVWKPWDEAVPTDDRASVLALAHLTCDLVGNLRRDGFPGDQWRLAIAAFGSSLTDVRASAGVPAAAAGFVEQVETHVSWYAERLPIPTRSQLAVLATPTPTAVLTPSLTAKPAPGRTTTAPPPAGGAPQSAPPPPPPVSWTYTGFGDASGLHLNGSARVADGRLELTTGLGQAGSAWAKDTISTSTSFETAFTAVISQPTDGLALVLQAEGPTALGGTGGGIGYGAKPTHNGDVLIRPSVAIEVDSWSNGWDPAGDQHVALTVNGDLTRHLASADPGFDVRNNQPFAVWVEYNARTHTLAVYASQGSTRPANPLFTHSIDLRSQLGTDRAYLGLTGATGATNLTDSRETVLSWRASSPPVVTRLS